MRTKVIQLSNNRKRKKKIDNGLLYRIARDYYLNGLKEEAIAIKENISRPHVSRLLSLARENKIVQFKVVMPEEIDVILLKNRLQELSKLDFLEVVYVPEEHIHDFEYTSLSIAYEACSSIKDYLKNCKYTGLGWGYTIYQTSKQLFTSDYPWGGTFVPLIGVSNENSPYLQISTILNQFADKFRGKAIFINVPVVMDEGLYESKMAKDKLRKLQHHWDQLDSAIIGFGVPFDKCKHFMIGEVKKSFNKHLKNIETLGDILVNFFDVEGNQIRVNQENKIVSIDLDKLQSISKVLCLAGGIDKAQGLKKIIDKKIIKGLVTDSNTAKRLIELYES